MFVHVHSLTMTESKYLLAQIITTTIHALSIYVKVLKAIFVIIESPLNCYELYTTTLQDAGFKLNHYDKCVGNNSKNGSQ